MKYKLSSKSRSRLVGVNPALVAVVERAIEITEIDFSVVEGLRTKERQKELFEAGASWTMQSKHLTGDAVDLYPWENGETVHTERAYKLVAKAMFRASQELGIVVEWGGLWIDTVDKPHWQLRI